MISIIISNILTYSYYGYYSLCILHIKGINPTKKINQILVLVLIMIWHLFLLLVPVLLIMPIIEINAAENYDVGISISKKCKMMLQNNYTTTCPTIDQILAVFPDTSPKVMGKFIVIDGITQRESTNYSIKNPKQYFRSIGNDGRVWIDPPAGIQSSIKMINIESNFDDYPIKGSSYSMSNNTISRGTERHVNYGCSEAMIDSDNWIFLAGDTINYMTHGCDEEYTNFNHIKKTYYEKSYQDIRTSYKYILEKWIESSKIKCLNICKEY